MISSRPTSPGKHIKESTSGMAYLSQGGRLTRVTAPFSPKELGQGHKARQTLTMSGQPWAEIQDVEPIWALLPTPQGSGFLVQRPTDAQPYTFRGKLSLLSESVFTVPGQNPPNPVRCHYIL